MRDTLKLLKELIKTLWYILKRLPWMLIYYICLKTLYWVTHEKGDIDGILSKRKYRRIKQSIRYKLWVWYNMRWLCKWLKIDFSCYEQFYKNNKILKY